VSGSPGVASREYTVDGSLVGPRAKIDRGKEHLADFASILGRIGRDDLCSVDRESHLERAGWDQCRCRLSRIRCHIRRSRVDVERWVDAEPRRRPRAVRRPRGARRRPRSTRDQGSQRSHPVGAHLRRRSAPLEGL